MAKEKPRYVVNKLIEDSYKKKYAKVVGDMVTELFLKLKSFNKEHSPK